ncbi:MAG: hypothetical protein OHK0029_16130 [Armatimonadaceae bacterium]
MKNEEQTERPPRGGNYHIQEVNAKGREFVNQNDTLASDFDPNHADNDALADPTDELDEDEDTIEDNSIHTGTNANPQTVRPGTTDTSAMGNENSAVGEQEHGFDPTRRPTRQQP